MGIVSYVSNGVKKLFNLSLTDEKAWNPSLWTFSGSLSLSGETVTEETALTYSAVWNAVSLIAGTIAALPLHLMQKVDDKKKRVVDDDPLYYVMHDSPNPFMTAMAFRETFMSHILTWGNGYAEKVMTKTGQVKELWPIPPNRVLKIQFIDNNLWYEIKVDSDSVWLPREKVLHVPGLGFDGYVGYSVISQMAKKSIGLGMAMETFGSRYFGSGTHPGVVVTHPGPALSPEAHANLKKSLVESHSGLGQSHRLMLLEEGMSIVNLSIPPNDSQFLESRQFQIPEIARWFNLPPHKLKDLTKSSFNNIESEQQSFVTDSLVPWLVRLEQNYWMQLLTVGQKRQRMYWKHAVEGLLRGNSKDRAKFYKDMFGVGMSINQILEKEDMNPIDHEFADIPWVPANNMIPLTMVREFLQKNNGKEGDMEDIGNANQTSSSSNDTE